MRSERMPGNWTVRLVEVSERDFQEIIRRSAQEFGPLQAEVYAQTLALAVEALRAEGLKAIGVKQREELGPGLYTLHAATRGRRARHFLVFRVVEIQTVEVLRVLHDRMDLARHVPRVPDSPPHV